MELLKALNSVDNCPFDGRYSQAVRVSLPTSQSHARARKHLPVLCVVRPAHSSPMMHCHLDASLARPASLAADGWCGAQIGSSRAVLTCYG
ncbi:jg1209 [Pararge aegeria aegeria]|uniref:Jg1209 protein n=1 Tax=Pararge aegeria aegeria TaxID=348720 RepID=A0A8S4R9A1_9NEOP|nr:jg1209 [Pararge aegeria aegeria]